jgi:hypothetical protein
VQIRKAEQLAEENKLDKSYRKRVQELKEMQKLALQKDRQRQQVRGGVAHLHLCEKCE